MPQSSRSISRNFRLVQGRSTRCWTFLFGLLAMLLVALAFGTEPYEGPVLGNPAEKFFDDTPVPKTTRSKARFSDNDVASPIRQTADTIPSVWDHPATAAETTLADWGVGPTLSAPTVGNPPPQTVDPMASPTVNPYAVDPALGANPYANFQQNLYTNPYFGTGHYDPHSINQINQYAQLYAAGGYNPYGYYTGQYDPMLMMAQQSSTYPFPQGFNGSFSNAGAVESPMNTKESTRNDADSEDPKPGSEWTMQRLMPLKVSSPLGETLLSAAKVISPFNTPTGPDKGVGQPLVMRSWQDHPAYFGGFVGYISGSQLVDKMIDQSSGANGGLKLGYNFNDYWGVEGRLHFASIDIRETAYGREVYDAWYAASFPDAPYLPLTTRSNHLTTLDVSVQYYPLGNAKWRPFFTYGLGVTRESFVDTFGKKNRVDALSMPIGVGLRYWWNEHLAIQADIVDNIVFSTGQTKTQGNFAFTVGASYAFGMGKKRRPTAYWPYTPSMGSRR